MRGKNNSFYFLKFFVLIYFSITFINIVIANNSIANAVVIDNKNRILIGGSFDNMLNLINGSTDSMSHTDFLLVRYNEDGTLDTTFNPAGSQPGVVVTNINSEANDVIYAIVIDGSNRIVVTGITDNGTSSNIVVARYNEDGSLDTTFNPSGLVSGIPGIVITDIQGNVDGAFDVIIDISGNIVVAGFTNFGTKTDVVVARYNEDGTLDQSFNPNGLVSGIPGIVLLNIIENVQTNLSGEQDIAYALTTDLNNRIYIAGSANNGLVTSFLIARFNQDGSLDQTFNANGQQQGFPGVVILTLQGADVAYDIKFYLNDKILIVGKSSNGVDSDFALVRLNIDGSFDTSFNPNGLISGQPGIVITDFGLNDDIALSCAIDFNNKIVVTGYAIAELAANETTVDQVSTTSFLTARYNIDGSLDQTFNSTGTPGFILLPIVNTAGINTNSSATSRSHSVAIDQNSNIVVTGYSFDGFENDVTTVRYTPEGNLDETFNPTGLLSPGILISNITNGQTPINQTFGGPAPVIDLRNINNIIIPEKLAAEVLYGKIGFQTPIIFSPEKETITNNPKVHIFGIASPLVTINLLANDYLLSSVKADYKGYWDIELPKLNDGTYKIQAIAVDPISKLTLSSSILNIMIQTKIPKVPIIFEPKNNEFFPKKDILVQGFADPNVFVGIYVNNKLVDVVQADLNGKWGLSLFLSDGQYSLSAHAIDIAKNISPFSKPILFSVDTAKPKDPIVYEPINNSIIQQSSMLVKGEFKPNSPINLFINEKLVSQTKSDSDGKWSFKLENLVNDQYKLYVEGIDKVKNLSMKSKTINFEVRTILPDKSVLQNKESQANLYIKGQSIPKIDLALFIDGKKIANIEPNSQGFWSFGLTEKLDSGTHKINLFNSDGNILNAYLIQKYFKVQ